MLLILPIAVAHDPELEGLAAGSQLMGYEPPGNDARMARDAFRALGWRSGIYASGRGYVEMLLVHDVADAAAIMRVLAAAYADPAAARALQFNGVDTNVLGVVDAADPADVFIEGRARHLHEVIGIDVCVDVDEMTMDDLLRDTDDGPIAQEISTYLLARATSRDHARPDEEPAGHVPTLGDTMFS